MSKMEEKKAIIEHNTMIAELLEKLAELDIDNEKKDELFQASPFRAGRRSADMI